jgi:hypothetical protein
MRSLAPMFRHVQKSFANPTESSSTAANCRRSPRRNDREQGPPTESLAASACEELNERDVEKAEQSRGGLTDTWQWPRQ